MARPISDGSRYFPLDTDIFNDNKIRILRANYGADGFTFYIYLVCQIYKEHYFLKADDDLIDLFASDLNMSVEKISLMLNFLLRRSLFDNKLFKSDKVLTSAGIQKRYCEMVKKKGEYRAIIVRRKFWLLSKEETPGFIKFAHFKNFKKENDGFGEENDGFGEENPCKLKEIKKEENIIFKPPSVDEVKEYCDERKNGINPEKFVNYYQSKNWMVGKNKMKDWKAAVRTWEQNNKKNESEEVKYNVW